MRNSNIQIEFKFPLKITKKRKWYVASCPVLDVASQGETEKKARENLFEALTLFITTSFEMGTLNEVLKQCGFKTSGAKIIKPSQKDYINIPVNLLQTQAGPETCHA